MKNVAVLIRVYDRVDDLKYNLQIINDLWKQNNYKIYVSFNGKSNGYELDKSIYKYSEQVIELEQNAGHLEGNSQLLLEGMKNIELSNFDYLIILEADTWLMGDNLIVNYISKLESTSAVWASSEWVGNRYSVGVDFAIIKASFISKHYKNMFTFTTMAEMWIAEYMMNIDVKYLFIDELMPVHRPSLIKSIYNADGGRVRVFPKGNMITHHIENLDDGIKRKKELADIVYGKKYFTKTPNITLYINYYLYLSLQSLLKILPRSSWIKKKKYTFKDKTDV